jgi:glycosyltransferase involved in cell wall biosynthesis
MEGIPVVLMEAMACGMPVVATNAGAVGEIVEDMLVEQGSPEQLAGALRYLAENPDQREIQGRRNRRIVEERFSRDNVAQLARLLQET